MFRMTFLIGILVIFCNGNSINTTVANNTNETSLDYRLGTDIIPTRYDLEITTYFKENEVPNKKPFTFDEKVDIFFIPQNDSIKKIVLHAKNLDIKGYPNIYRVRDDKPTKVTNMTYDSNTDKLTILLNTTFSINTEYIMRFDSITGQINEDPFGFHRSSYKINNSVIWIGATQFQPVHARKVFPCFDEPQFKATFTLKINHSREFNAVSNTEVAEKVEIGDRVITSFKKTPKMSTYLLGFIVSDFETNGNQTEVAVYAQKELHTATNFAKEAGNKILAQLDKITGKPYKELGNSKMHLAAVPDRAGAMENWGLLIFRENYLLYDENHSILKKIGVATIIAHEQAHQWFGDYVTCAWWNVTWLNEGFATYFQYFATHDVYPEWNLDKHFIIEQLQAVFLADISSSAHPLTNNKTNSPDEVQGMFDSITYNKGASIIRMISHMMGQDKFKKAIQTYFKNEKIILNTALPEDLFRAFKSEFDEKIVNLTEIQKDWTEQVGYPVVTVTLSDDRKQFKISQKRFVLNENVTQQDLKYTIPITFATNKKSDFTNTTPDFYLLKNENEQTKNLTDVIEWIVVNKLQTGYYRVNYDNKTWKAVYEALKKENFSGIPEENRAQIVDDLFNFGKIGLMDYDHVLYLTDYLKNESNYFPWKAAYNGLSFIASRLNENEKTNEKLRKHIHSLAGNVYKKLTFNESNEEKVTDIYKRVLITNWLCQTRETNCVENSKHYFANMKEKNQSFPINVRSIIYCTVLREGDVTEFDYLWNKYKNEDISSEKDQILKSLGCSKSENVIEKLLNLTLTDEIPRKDKSTVLASAYSGNKGNAQIIFNNVQKNLTKFIDSLGALQVAQLVSNVASKFTSSKQKAQLQEFYDNEKVKFGNSSVIIENALKTVEANLDWAEKRLPKLKDYLDSHYPDDATSLKSMGVMLMMVICAVLLKL